MPHPTLSKSRFLAAMQCRKKLWLLAHRPELATPAPEALRRILDQGTRVGMEARTRFPSGVLVSAPHADPAAAVEETQKLMGAGTAVVFEAAFVADDTIIRADVLERDGNRWRLIEVKSTTGVKEYFVWDVAVQLYVLRGCGVEVSSCSLMHLSRQCVHPDLSNLFHRADLSPQAEERLPQVPALIAGYRELVARPEAPFVPVGSHCCNPFDCQFRAHCWRDVPRTSIFTIPRLAKHVGDDLAARGIVSLEELPEGTALPPSGRAYVEMVRSGRPRIDVAGIRVLLRSLTYPLYFLDFETAADAIPRLPGLSPYDAYPFQYSIHVMAAEGGLTHLDYLHPDASDPRLPLAEALATDIGPTGTIVAYNASFEQGRIGELSEFVRAGSGELSTLLDAMVSRFFDLLDVFRHHYLHPGFLGSNSIKSVLPVLVPDLSYDELEISDGSHAQAVWSAAIGMTDPREKARNMDALAKYCRLDTLAMVRIVQALSNL